MLQMFSCSQVCSQVIPGLGISRPKIAEKTANSAQNILAREGRLGPVTVIMGRKYKIGWLPGDGIGVEVLEAARIVLDKLDLGAEYLPGDIGWEWWCREGDPLPARTVELLKNVDAALFGAITSKP